MVSSALSKIFSRLGYRREDVKQFQENGDCCGFRNPPADKHLIDINKADVLSLQDIPGIGEAKAKAIVRWREKKRIVQDLGPSESNIGLNSLRDSR